MSKLIWLDTQLSPLLAKWMHTQFKIECIHLREIGLKKATDKNIVLQTRKQNAIIITKDSDFQDLLLLHSSPPKIIWITCGNTSNDKLKRILKSKLPQALKLL